jgi:hypothetical protein
MNLSPINSYFFDRWMTRSYLVLAGSVVALLLITSSGFAQEGPIPSGRIPGADDKRDPETASIQEMAIKQQISRRKKEYDEMLKRGEEALKLSETLANSYETNQKFSDQDLQKLQELEKVVSKIREELGGNDDADKDQETSADGSENSARQSIGAAFKFLRSSTIKLVDELKKSTRFSISVAAIQTSNAVIKFARFLRLRK